ncbi:hypothetical protein BD413DRAFT_567569 [Trametes elegans]|nr:hypothetical protein BD413DRAFT_567569 [Trametes elegans]
MPRDAPIRRNVAAARSPSLSSILTTLLEVGSYVLLQGHGLFTDSVLPDVSRSTTFKYMLSSMHGASTSLLRLSSPPAIDMQRVRQRVFKLFSAVRVRLFSVWATAPESQPGTVALAPQDQAIHVPTASSDEVLRSKLEDANEGLKTSYAHFAESRGTKGVKALEKAEDVFIGGDKLATTALTIFTKGEAVYESDAMAPVRESINTFVEDNHVILDILDGLGNLHPYIKGAVGAFRVVVKLDAKRRDNEKKITVIFVKMYDMMKVLCELQNIKDEDTPGPDGTTIKARMQTLLDQTTKDIKECANACDTYSKKKLIVKVLRSSSWDSKFVGFLNLFSDRREAFMLALNMHVGKGVDKANAKLDKTNEKLDRVDENLTLLLKVFTTLVPPDQQQLADIVRARGGVDAVVGNDSVLASLAKFKPSTEIDTAKSAGPDQGSRPSDTDTETDLRALKDELFESVDRAMQQNLEMFENKFLLQQQKLMQEMEGVIKHEGDLVVKRVLRGPQDRIKDRDIYALWSDMRWRGHIKARHFVLALREFYLQPLDQTYPSDDVEKRLQGEKSAILKKETSNSGRSQPADTEDLPLRSTNHADNWALQYIDLNNLSAIAEAFDDDASGFITVTEVNQFSSSRPQDWSLLQWLAFWAKGWQVVNTYYVVQINNLFAQMFGLLPHIRPENRQLASTYLENVWKRVTTFTASYQCAFGEYELWDRFKAYGRGEERRLEDGLKTFRHRIDGVDTVTLITGPGRIEKYLFPMLYLLLRRDLEIFRLSRQNVVIGHRELVESTESISWLLQCANYRGGYLSNVFQQRNLNPEEQFKTFACGMFHYGFDEKQLWSFKTLLNFDNANFMKTQPPDPNDEETLANPNDILNHATPAEGMYGATRESLTEKDSRTSDLVKPFLGRWYGFLGGRGVWPALPMVTFFLHASDFNAFETLSRTAGGYAYSIVGHPTATTDDGAVDFSSTWVFSSDNSRRFLKGRLSPDGQTMSGFWGGAEDELANEFFCTRASPEALTARPPPAEFRKHRIRALWRFALQAALDQVRRRPWRKSWRVYRKARKELKTTYMEYMLREQANKTLSEEEYAAVANCERQMTFDEACSCFVELEMRRRISASENRATYWCDVCRSKIRGARWTCVTCTLEGDDTLDFCDKERCKNSFLKMGDAAHTPSHDMVKIRRYLFHYHDLPKLFSDARDIITRARRLFQQREDESSVAEAPGIQEPLMKAPDGLLGLRPSQDHRDAKDKGEDAGSVVESTNEVAGIRSGLAMSSARAHPVPLCVSCSAKAALPCLVCIDCKDREDVYICEACDAIKGGINAGEHLSSHSLVRCMSPDVNTSGEDVIDERLRALESRVAGYSDRFSALDDKVTRIERLLEIAIEGAGESQVEQEVGL